MNSTTENQTLKDVYTVIAELWCSPPEDDPTRQGIRNNAGAVAERLKGVEEEGAKSLSMFLREDDISDEDYIDLFELDPQCALYLGSHSYDEPKTCANAAMSDRNEYMIDLSGVYKHFGQMPNGRELPDYLPLMVDFLSLTTEANDDPVRDKFIEEYFLPYLPPLRTRLEELKTPYLFLLDALEKVVNLETKTQPPSEPRDQKVEHYVG